MPEVVGAVLVLATAGCALLYATSMGHERWQEASGRVVRGEAVPSRDLPRPSDKQVRVNYEYRVEGERYTAEYKGYWPSAGSPNALPEDQLEVLTKEGHPLTVLYQIDNPARSQLHVSGQGHRLAYIALTFVAGIACAGYFLLVYPGWRDARG